MSMRTLIGRHPSSGEMGMWIARQGYDCVTDDRTDRNKFLVSTNFAGRRPLRIIKAGISNTNSQIYLPTTLANLGGEPMLSYRVMENSTTERNNGYYGAENDGQGGGYGASEFQSNFVDGNPPYFVVLYNPAPSSTSYLIRYMIALY